MPINTTNITTQLEDQELTTNLNYLQPTGFKLLIEEIIWMQKSIHIENKFVLYVIL